MGAISLTSDYSRSMQYSTPLPDPNDPLAGLILDDPAPAASPSLVPSHPDGTVQTGFIDSLETFAGDAIDSIGSGIEKVATKVYSGAKTVAGDVTGGVEQVVGFGVNQTMILVVGVAVLLFVAGKAGVFKVVAKAL